MGFGLIGILVLIPLVIALVAQWIGVIAMLHRGGKGWWVMAAGVTLSTLGPPVLALGMCLFGSAGAHSPTGALSSVLHIVIPAFALGSGIGAVTFGIGFALHALGLNAAAERQQQLEAMTAAMAEELRQLRGN